MAPPDPRTAIDAHLRRPWRERTHAADRTCAWPGCGEPGAHRAPRSRQHLRDFIWLCLDHVRAYNSAWDFFAGMSTDEIDAYRRADVTWHRPTWTFGSRASAGVDPKIHDPFGFVQEPEPRPRPSGPESEAIQRLGLEPGFTFEGLRRRYKQLVKEHHPDLHPGDPAAAERLRLVIEAYRYLRDHGHGPA